MIQEADIGIGISGVEGMQICYFFYKNITFGLTIFYFEAYTMFSGQTLYNDWFMSLFNVIFTSLPVIALGVFEQDISSKVCMQFPAGGPVRAGGPAGNLGDSNGCSHVVGRRLSPGKWLGACAAHGLGQRKRKMCFVGMLRS